MSADLHARTIELLPAYALGCLDSEEATAVAGHLAECALCRAELAAYEEVTGQLSLGAPDSPPPPALKQTLMARIQSPAHARASVPAATEPAPTAQRLPGPTWPWLGRMLPAWAALSAILVLALTFSNFMLWQQLNQTRAQGNAMRTVALTGTEAAPGALATIVVGTDGRQGALVADDLQMLDSEHQYQLWLIKDGQRTSGGVFSVDEHGYGGMRVSTPRPLWEFDSFGVTVEPKGGSPGPTGQRVLAGSF